MINGGLRTKGIKKEAQENKPLITVITVVYNGVKTLEQTILSVINQTYENIEYIIIDGGSSDGTLDLIKKFEDKIDYWQSEPDKGIYDAMNKGIELATGEYIYIIGCDDWLVNTNIFDEIKKYLIKGYDVISGQVWAVNNNGFQHLYYNRYEYTKDEDIAYQKIYCPHQGMFVRKSVMLQKPFDIKFKIAADYKSLLSFWLDPTISVLKINKVISFYNNEGLSSKLRKLRRIEMNAIHNEFKIWNKEWYKNKGAIQFFLWILKNKFISLGISNIKAFVLNIIFILIKKEIKHSCEWKFCRFCK